MKRVSAVLVIVLCFSQYALAEAAKTEKAKKPPPPSTALAKAKPVELSEEAKAQKAAQDCFDKIVAAYMHAKWKDLASELKAFSKHKRLMSREQKKDVAYIRGCVRHCRPSWWKKARSSSNVSFKAKIWGRTIQANYMPTEYLGVTRTVGIRRGKILVIVSWKPNLVDNPRPAGGKLAKKHKITKGDIGEMVVWHELGHNYLTSFLPVKHVITLYWDHYLLYKHLQEYYADMTSLTHGSPPARLATMMLRLDGLAWYDDDEAHARAAHGIGAFILAEVLTNPDKWPSFHFPPKVPKDEAERKAIIYLYENIDANWTLAEDKRLREMSRTFIRRKGGEIFKKKGRIPLVNGLKFQLMATDDRDYQIERDEWVTKKLKEVIKSGRADKPPKDKKKGSGWSKRGRIEIPW